MSNQFQHTYPAYNTNAAGELFSEIKSAGQQAYDKMRTGLQDVYSEVKTELNQDYNRLTGQHYPTHITPSMTAQGGLTSAGGMMRSPFRPTHHASAGVPAQTVIPAYAGNERYNTSNIWLTILIILVAIIVIVLIIKMITKKNTNVIV